MSHIQQIITCVCSLANLFRFAEHVLHYLHTQMQPELQTDFT